MAGLPAMLRRLQPEDIKAAATWGVAAVTNALYLIQPWDWLRKTLFEEEEPEQK